MMDLCRHIEGKSAGRDLFAIEIKPGRGPVKGGGHMRPGLDERIQRVIG
jgi:hypothetical protein